MVAWLPWWDRRWRHRRRKCRGRWRWRRRRRDWWWRGWRGWRRRRQRRRRRRWPPLRRRGFGRDGCRSVGCRSIDAEADRAGVARDHGAGREGGSPGHGAAPLPSLWDFRLVRRKDGARSRAVSPGRLLAGRRPPAGFVVAQGSATSDGDHFGRVGRPTQRTRAGVDVSGAEHFGAGFVVSSLGPRLRHRPQEQPGPGAVGSLTLSGG